MSAFVWSVHFKGLRSHGTFQMTDVWYPYERYVTYFTWRWKPGMRSHGTCMTLRASSTVALSFVRSVESQICLNFSVESAASFDHDSLSTVNSLATPRDDFPYDTRIRQSRCERKYAKRHADLNESLRRQSRWYNCMTSCFLTAS